MISAGKKRKMKRKGKERKTDNAPKKKKEKKKDKLMEDSKQKLIRAPNTSKDIISVMDGERQMV